MKNLNKGLMDRYLDELNIPDKSVEIYLKAQDLTLVERSCCGESFKKNIGTYLFAPAFQCMLTLFHKILV